MIRSVSASMRSLLLSRIRGRASPIVSQLLGELELRVVRSRVRPLRHLDETKRAEPVHRRAVVALGAELDDPVVHLGLIRVPVFFDLHSKHSEGVIRIFL